VSAAPLLSYIVLSYDYERYIGTTLQSILDQTIQDFEVLVIDDASHDASVQVVRGFGDPRIRLLLNEHNLGGAASYNRAVEAARGEWLVNLDADDWVAPQKAEVQLSVAEADPDLDIIGTWVSIVDSEGRPHPRAQELEALIDQPYEFGRLDTWVGANHLCRSSTMVKRTTHLRIGLDDPTMVRAPDYELWTRALRAGCRFGLVPEKLTFLRLQPHGVTHSDRVGTLLEMSYAMLRNLVPHAESRALLPSYERMVTWLARNPNLSALRPAEAHRLLGMLITSPPLGDYASFRAVLGADDADPTLASIGRRCLALMGDGAAERREITGLARWHEYQALRWEDAYHAVSAEVAAEDGAPPGFWRAQSGAWETAHASLVGRLAAILGSPDP
jgi:GT2 family glycosyltransferase